MAGPLAEGDFVALADIAVATGAAGSAVTYQNGVLTIPRGRAGAVDFGDLTVETGAPGTSVSIENNVLSVPRGADGDVTEAHLQAELQTARDYEAAERVAAVDAARPAPVLVNGARGLFFDELMNLLIGLLPTGLWMLLADEVIEDLAGRLEYDPTFDAGVDVSGARPLILDLVGQMYIAAQRDGIDFVPAAELIRRWRVKAAVTLPTDHVEI